MRRDGAALGTTSGTSFFDDTLAGGRTYVYEVIAIGADGARSAPAGVTLDTPSGAPAGPAGPPAPAGLVTAESYEGLLREAVALINREFLESTLDEIDDLTSGFRTTEGDGFAGATFVSSDTGERFGGGTGRFDLYSCDAGGSVRALVEFGAAVSPDDARFDDLMELRHQVSCIRNGEPGALPDTLEPQAGCDYGVPTTDPVTGAPYGYERLADDRFRLCADFEDPTRIAERVEDRLARMDDDGCLLFEAEPFEPARR